VREPPAAAGRPAAIHVVGALPQLPSGKHDRRALLELSARLARIERLSEPPDSLYALVLHLWEDVLGVRGIGLGESFFDVGGHSLLAVRLRARVEERVGRSVPLEVFFADPTIAGMVRALRAGERASIAPLLALSTSGAKQPLFFLHGDPSGLGLYCRTFAPSLGAERPIYAIAPHGTDGGNVPATIEEMARDQIALIRERRPHGPYLIGGYCMGAIVAFEIARQLEQAGETVTHLILIEAQSARPRFGFVEDAVTGAARFSGLSEDACRRWLARRRFEVQAALRYVRRRPAPTADAEVDNTARVLTAQQDAVHRYVWRSLRTSATLICAQEEPNANVGAVRLMWRSLLSALEVRLVPGNHKTALGAHIDVLTAAFAQIFERLDV
jgi:thioesterase domain-containing protein